MVRYLEASCGMQVLAGENARENDRLCQKAHPYDLWFHLKDTSSPHVILCCGKDLAPRLARRGGHPRRSDPPRRGKSTAGSQPSWPVGVPETAIEECCQLCKWYSKKRGATSSVCIFLPSSFVIRTSTPGTVTLSSTPHEVSVHTNRALCRWLGRSSDARGPRPSTSTYKPAPSASPPPTSSASRPSKRAPTQEPHRDPPATSDVSDSGVAATDRIARMDQRALQRRIIVSNVTAQPHQVTEVDAFGHVVSAKQAKARAAHRRTVDAVEDSAWDDLLGDS